MRSNLINNILSKGLYLIITCFLLACGSPKEQKDEQPIMETSEPTQKAEPSSIYYYINSATNESLAEMIVSGDMHTIKTADLDLFGKLKTDKRKYYNQNDEFTYAVKYGDGLSFKLRDNQEQLIWKVKVTDDKVKIANNEEMENAYEIKLSENGKIKLKQNEEELKAIRFDNESNMTRVGNNYQVRGFNGSMVMGVLLIDELSEIEKFVICTEILGSAQ